MTLTGLLSIQSMKLILTCILQTVNKCRLLTFVRQHEDLSNLTTDDPDLVPNSQSISSVSLSLSLYSRSVSPLLSDPLVFQLITNEAPEQSLKGHKKSCGETASDKYELQEVRNTLQTIILSILDQAAETAELM